MNFLEFLIVLIIAMLVLSLASRSEILNPRDDTDPPLSRSGLKVLTDNKTGLQYLKCSGGGLVQRMGTDGKQLSAFREGE